MDNNKILKYEGKNANKLARKYVSNRWDDKVSLVSGKRLIKELNKWLNNSYKCNINATSIAVEFKKGELDNEMKKILTAIEKLTGFN